MEYMYNGLPCKSNPIVTIVPHCGLPVMAIVVDDVMGIVVG